LQNLNFPHVFSFSTEVFWGVTLGCRISGFRRLQGTGAIIL